MKSFTRCLARSTSKMIFLSFGVTLTQNSYIFLETEPAKEINMEDTARKNAEEITKVIKANLRVIGGGRVRDSLFSNANDYLTDWWFSKLSFPGLLNALQSMLTGAKKPHGHDFMEKLLQSGKPIDELANSILAVAVISTVEMSQGKFAHFSLMNSAHSAYTQQ